MSAYSGSEHRGMERHMGQTLGEIALQVEPDAAVYKGHVRDWTIQGMAIVTDLSVLPGAHVTVHLRLQHRTVTIDAEVKHATALEDGRWLLGCRFSRLLSVDDVFGDA